MASFRWYKLGVIKNTPNSSAPDFLYTFVDVQNSEVGRNERSVVNSLCKDQGSCAVI